MLDSVSGMVTTRLVLVLAALLGAFAPIPPTTVERWYSTGFFGILQPIVTGLSNRTSLSLFDALVGGGIAVWLILLAADVARRRAIGLSGVTWRLVRRTATVAALLYLAFLLMWGINYRRVPLVAKVPYDATQITPEHARALLATTVGRLNALHGRAHTQGWADLEAPGGPLAGAFARASRRVGVAWPVEPGRPKHTRLQWYFRRVAVQGMTDPFFLETLVNADLLPFERPLAVAHEWAHLAGFVDEGEANFVGWLATREATTAAEYSGWLFLYGEAARAVPGAARDEETARLADGPRADLAAVADRLRRQTNPRLSAAAWRAYDQYLRANRVEAGTASYGEVVQLILGTGTAAE